MQRFIVGHAVAFSFLFLVVASIRIALTWNIFNATLDEATHIACGMEWLERGTYQLEDQHPPLARVVAAVALYVQGLRGHKGESANEIGKNILVDRGKIDRNLALARAGELPFFWIAGAIVFLWAVKAIGRAGAVAAVLIFSHAPPVLAHAGLATTDMALSAMLAAAVFTAVTWLEHPTLVNGAILGIACGLAALAKFSSLPFFVCALTGLLILRAWAQPDSSFDILGKASLCLGLLVAFLVVWAGYRFSFGPLRNLNITVPAPEFFSGIRSVYQHNKLGIGRIYSGLKAHPDFGPIIRSIYALRLPYLSSF